MENTVFDECFENILKKYGKYVKIIPGEFETILTKPVIHSFKVVIGQKTKLRREKMKKNSTLYLTRGALVAAMYVALTYISTMFGLSSGVIQFRISEMLCILPIFMPEAVLGLSIGCVLANIVSACPIWDVILGACATLIGAIGARLLRKLPNKLMWLATVPTILANAIIIPLVLIFFYEVKDAYFYLFFTVGLGEAVCAGIGGSLLYYSLEKSNFF